jgi:hypothetical protein
MAFSMILYNTVHRLMGLKSLTKTAFYFFGINAK